MSLDLYSLEQIGKGPTALHKKTYTIKQILAKFIAIPSKDHSHSDTILAMGNCSNPGYLDL